MQVISNGAEAAKGHAVEIWVVSPGKASHPFPATYYLLELCVLQFLSPYEEIEDRHVLVWCCSPIEISFLCHPVQKAVKAQLRGQFCHNRLLPSRGVPCVCKRDREINLVCMLFCKEGGISYV